MESRPNIKLSLSRLDKSLELVSRFVLFIMIALTVYALIKLPATIPVHFNASGQADNYGGKATILILPIIAAVIYFGLSQINKYPHRFNYLTKITNANAEQQYTIATRTLRFLKLAILIVFTTIIFFTCLTAAGISNGLGIWFLPLTLALILLPTIILIVQSVKTAKHAG